MRVSAFFKLFELGLQPQRVGVQFVSGLLQLGDAVLDLVDLIQVALQADD